MTILLESVPSLRLRREHFGGIAFDKDTGLTIDLDRSAFLLLRAIQKNSPVSEAVLLDNLSTLGIKGSHRQAAEVLEELIGLQLLVRRPAAGANESCGGDGLCLAPPDDFWPPPGHLTAPVTVHWAVTHRCSLSCPDCYIRRGSKDPGEMGTDDALEAISALAEWGVFQLAIGGGEPLVRSDMARLASEAAEQDLVVHVTTGPAGFTDETIRDLAPAVTVLQFGIDENRLLEQPEGEIKRLKRGLQMARGMGLKTGASLKLSRTCLTNLKTVFSRLRECGFEHITLLRYKPPPSLGRWKAENPPQQLLKAGELFVLEAAREAPNLSIRVDCALSFFFRGLKQRDARKRGIRGCVAARRIAGMDPQGYLVPCSQLAAPQFRAGNILSDSPQRIWRESKTLKRYRHFRQREVFSQSQCGVCPASDHCGGCRALAPDALGADPFCPDPQLPPLQQLGEDGRRVDVKDYVASRGCISVGQYCRRYGVGRKKAVRELDRYSFLTTECSDSAGGGRDDLYVELDRGLAPSIQQTIGSTSGGAPYATCEQIVSWLQEDSPEVKYEGYPLWLMPDGVDCSREE